MILFKRGKETLQVGNDAWTEMVTFLSNCGWNPSVPAYFFLASNYHAMNQADAHALNKTGQAVLAKALHDPLSVYPGIRFDMGKFSEVVEFAAGGKFSISHAKAPPGFRSFAYSDGNVGFPCVVSPDQDEVIIGDYSGNLHLVSVSEAAVTRQAFVATKLAGAMACQCLRCLALAPAGTTLCAVATTGGHAAVWDVKNDNVMRIYPQDGSVNSVAWLRGGEALVIGTGYYPLSPSNTAQARIEAWCIDGTKPELAASCTLPGVCVDWICVDDDQLICATGMPSQQQGFLSVIDPGTFRPMAFFEVPFAMVRRVECSDSTIFVANRGSVRAIHRNDGKEKWVHEASGDSLDFACDCDEGRLFLSNGQLMSCRDGHVVKKLDSLPGCCTVTPRPEGGFVGVTTSGQVGVWDATDS